MTTYSTVLKLELPGDGQQVGTWGQTTNKNFGTLVEQAITGVKYITMIDADYTLTDLNGASDEARNAVIIAQGTNNAIRKVVIPLNNKVYLVSNQTVGGYSIRIGASTGNYVTIPNGITAFVYCDGTNTISGSNGSVDNFTVSGALSVTGNATVSGNTSLTGTLGVGGAASFTNSVGFSVTPTAPTQAPGTNNTTLATTAFTTAAVTAGLGTLGTMALQNANNVAITGGTLSGMTSVAGGAHSGTTATFSGAVTGGSGVFGAVSGTTGTFTGAVSGTTGTFSAGVSGTTGTFSAGVSGTTGTFSGAISGTTGTFTGIIYGQNSLKIGNGIDIGLFGDSTNVAIRGYSSGVIYFQSASAGNVFGYIGSSGINLQMGYYSGSGAGLTGTAAGLSIGGNAATATNATQAANATAVNGASSNGYGNRTVSSSSPSGGSNGDIWYQV